MRRFLVAAVAVVVLAGIGAAQAQEFKWRMATIDRETGVYWNKISAPYAKLVAELTGGRMVIEPLPAGSIGNIFKLYDAVSDGLVEMANVPPAFLGTKDPTNAMILAYPTGLGVDSFLSWVYIGGGNELLKAHRAETMKMHSIVVGTGPSELFAHSHVPIRSVADLKNKKYRTLGNWAAVVRDKFGAAPTTVPGSEIYGMLEKKGIDMTEYSMPSENFARGYHEVAKYIIYPGIHAGAWGFEAVMTLENWNKLPKDIQMAMEVAGKIVTHESLMGIIQADFDAMIKLQQGDNEWIELSDEFKKASQEGARAWAVEAAAKAKAAGNPWPEKVANSIFAFQDRWRANSKYLVVDHRN
jgi:TRAP-type mannitol/chloroaromatic compound transport system substrate-binding protein